MVCTFSGLESEKGRVMDIIRSLGALARAIGPICASASYWLIGATYTYICGGILLIIPLLCLKKLPVDIEVSISIYRLQLIKVFLTLMTKESQGRFIIHLGYSMTCDFSWLYFHGG